MIDSSRLLGNARRFRRFMNWYPPYWGMGISVSHVSPDFRELTVMMKSRFYNRNAFGGHFGGSLSAMTDPFYSLMLVQILGRKYRVADASAHITFVKPARGTVRAPHRITDLHLEEIYAATRDGGKHFMAVRLDVLDESDDVVVRVDKRVYVRLRPENQLPDHQSQEHLPPGGLSS